MRWSKVKQLIEDRFAEPVKGRVSLFSTRYHGAHDSEGRASIRIDGKEVLNMSCYIVQRERSYKQQVDPTQPGVAFRDLDVTSENIFAGESLRQLAAYLDLSVVEILSSENPIIRALGMLDARVGKRKLLQIDVSQETELVRRLWQLRCESEELTVQQPPGATAPAVTSKIATDYWSQQYKGTLCNVDNSELILAASKRTRDVHTLLNHLRENTIKEQDLATSASRMIFAGFQQTDEPALFCQAVEHLLSCTKLLDDADYIKGVMAVICDQRSWRKPIAAWSPGTHNVRKQFASLVRHLFAQYDVPLFMDAAWLTNNPLHQNWYKHLGAGKNIRTAESMPVALTKRMAHCFLTAPDTCSIEAAIRWGQIIALGGDKRLTDAILDTRLATTFTDDPFWQSVLQFLIRNPMLDPAWINPIVDYIWNQKFEDRIEFTEAGVAEPVGPAQPNFSMHGRTVNSMIKQVEAWHGQLGRTRGTEQLQWKKSQINDFRFIEGTKESKNMKIWRIYELLSGALLNEEGRQLSHCVGSYAKSCVNRSSSIWTMDVQTKDSTEKRLTIEMRLSDLCIRQARGFRNRLPDHKETEIIQRWASQEGIGWR